MEGKKSFVLYTDFIHTVRKMPQDKIGRLFMTILEYVNDENPNVDDDMVLSLVFEPIRQQLKRDLEGWNKKSAKNSENGSKGGRPRKDGSHRDDDEQEDAQTDEKMPDETFEELWNLYDKKVGSKEKLQKKWVKLKSEERELIMAYIPKYVKSQPDRQYRKNLETFLNNKGWLDEIISSNGQHPATNGVKPPAETVKVPEFDGTPLTREKFRPQRREESYQAWLEKNNQFFEAQDKYNETLKKGN